MEEWWTLESTLREGVHFSALFPGTDQRHSGVPAPQAMSHLRLKPLHPDIFGWEPPSPLMSREKNDSRRISFMFDDATPRMSHVDHLRETKNYKVNLPDNSMTTAIDSRDQLIAIMSEKSPTYSKSASRESYSYSTSLREDDSQLLGMVRARNRELRDQDEALRLPRDDVSDAISNECCVHELSVRMTERSLSRSRISTRRDLDIPSILAFTNNNTGASDKPQVSGIPAFQAVNNTTNNLEIPRWSIRRSMCPVCSEKWKDRSSIVNIKYSGLKRNSSQEFPSVIAPARIRTSIAIGYVPRPTLAAVDEDLRTVERRLRNTSAIWQLTRARRFRNPKPQLAPSETITGSPNATANCLRKDLDLRVNKFIADK